MASFKALRAAVLQAKDAAQPLQHADSHGLKLAVDLSSALEVTVGGLAAAKYVRNAFTADDAVKLAQVVDSSPGFLTCKNRSLLNLGGIPSPDGMIAEPLPSWLADLVSALGLRANQALINRYAAEGSISAHKDGPNYEPHAHIVTVEGFALLYFASEKNLPPFGCVLLEPLSLFEFSQDLYENAFHYILPITGSNEAVPNGELAPANFAKGSVVPDSIPRLPRLSITLRWAFLAAKQREDYLDPEQLRAELNRRRTWWSKAVGDG